MHFLEASKIRNIDISLDVCKKITEDPRAGGGRCKVAQLYSNFINGPHVSGPNFEVF